ncbi:MAG: shikimate dehydrogenase [Sneathiellales bacterium]|nr:shikimate dehydrogenase [Sneathiellales bacterium]
MIKNAGVMGFPISHSLSPRLHGYWIEKYDLQARYLAREVKPENLENELRSLPERCLQDQEIFRGTNLTIPLKETALDLVDTLEEAARAIGAVNTVVLDDQNNLSGRNTDWIGFMDSLSDHLDIEEFKGKTALVLGAGGAARAIVYACLQMGFDKILVTNRTRARAEDLCLDMGSRCEVLDWKDRDTVLKEIDLLVNSTSLGMTGQPPLEISIAGLKEGAVVTDIVYVPLMTDLLVRAKEGDYRTVDGLGMLLHQAKAGFEAWFGVKPDVDEGLRQFVLQGLNKK